MAVSATYIFNITSPVATGVTLTPVAPFTGSGTSFTAPGPVASGVVCGAISISPLGWSGSLTLSGPDAAAFGLQGSNLVTASTWSAGATKTVAVTVSP